MDTTRQPIWIGTATATQGEASGCGDCGTTDGTAGCRSGGVRLRCDAPSLQGPTEAVQRALVALRAVGVPECGDNIVDGGQIRALRIDADEVELTLVGATSGCAMGSVMADDAFRVMRALHPDTDVYVLHDRGAPGDARATA